MATYDYAKVLIVDTLASLPSAAVDGFPAYVRDTNKFYFFNGAAWTEFTGTGSNTFSTINCSSGTDPVADSTTDTLNLTGGTGITVTGDSATDTVTIAATGAANAFTTIACSSGTNPVADSATDTLTLTAGTGISISGDSSTDTVTISSSGLVAALDVLDTAVTVNTDTTERTIYSYTLTGGRLGAGDALRLTLFTSFLNNTGSARGIRFRVYFGGSAVIDYDTGNIFAANANRRHQMDVVTIQAKGATNSNVVTWGHTAMGTSSTGTIHTGSGSGNATPAMWILDSGTLSIDTTVNQTISFTIQLSFSSANLEWSTYSGVLEHLAQ